jgi:hypothetical protein
MSTRADRSLDNAVVASPDVDPVASPFSVDVGTRTESSLVYLYCILEADTMAHRLLSERRVPGLIDRETLFPIEATGLVGAVSHVPAALFREEPLNALVVDLKRLTPFAVRHQAAIEALFAVAPAMVPLGFGSVYHDPERVVRMLRERAGDFARLLDRVRDRHEWGLRVTADSAMLRTSAESSSDALRKLAQAAANAPRGRAYLLTKQRERLIGAEADRLAGEALTALLQRLTNTSDEVRRDELPADPLAGKRQLVLKAAFLVKNSDGERFRVAIAELAQTLAPRGLILDLTGPWAPYSFVGRPS